MSNLLIPTDAPFGYDSETGYQFYLDETVIEFCLTCGDVAPCGCTPEQLELIDAGEWMSEDCPF